jgi:uncharacterized protein YutE (UPF0331/DUF86 family)
MAAFKDELSKVDIVVFGNHFSLLAVAVPMIVGILVAAYLGALAHFSSNITITRFALSKYLGIASNAVAILGLAYPMVVGLLVFLTWLLGSINISSDIASNLSSVVAAIASLVGAAFSVVASKTLAKLRAERDRVELIDKLDELRARHNDATGYSLLQQYEALVGYAVGFLKLQGYGFGSRSLAAIARELVRKQVLSPQDADVAGDLNSLRNMYAHGQKELTAAEIKDAVKKINTLRQKIEKALYNLADGTDAKA